MFLTIRSWVILCSLCLPLSVIAQKSAIQSPYSYFGLGELSTKDFAHTQSLGGLSAAYNDPFRLNTVNPASYGNLLYTSFDVGVAGKYSQLAEGDNRNNAYQGNLSYLALGFPLKNTLNRLSERKRSPFNIGLAFGLMPFSKSGYNLKYYTNSDGLDSIQNEVLGTGGLYRLFVGSGVKYKGFSAGFQWNYLFGKTIDERQITFPDNAGAGASLFRTENMLRGSQWQVGLQYEYVLPVKEDRKNVNKKRLTIGTHASSGSSLNQTYAIRDQLVVGTEFITIRDTSQEGTLQIPSDFGLGLSFAKDNHWMIGIDYKLSDWTKYENAYRQNETYGLSYRLALGASFTPNYKSFKNYFKRVDYRFGAFYGQLPKLIDGTQLNDYGITFGMGLPLRLPRGLPSFVDIAFEVGQYGSPNLINENYFKLTIGFTLNDNTWFYKRKFK